MKHLVSMVGGKAARKIACRGVWVQRMERHVEGKDSVFFHASEHVAVVWKV